MDTSDTIHRLADTTFRNTDELTGNLKKLISVSKSLSKALEEIVPLSEDFTSILDTIGSKAMNLPGGVRNLGTCLKEMATANRKIGSAFIDWTTSINTDLVVPLEDKLEREQPNIVKNWKGYKAEASKKESALEKSSTKLKAVRKKKISSENVEKENQLCQILEDQQRDLHYTRVEGLRKALIEQQKIYSFFIFHLCGVHHAQIEYSSIVYQALSTKINLWSSLTSNSEELPQESLVLLKNPHSPDAYKPPNTDSGSHFSFEDVGAIDQRQPPSGLPRSGSGPKQHHEQNQLEPQPPQNNPLTAADIRNIKAETNPEKVGQERKRRPSCRVKALHSFDPYENGQLSLKAGDLIDAISEEKEGWLYGSNSQTMQSGWFPTQYVDKVWWPTPEQLHRKTTQQPKSTLAPELPERDYLQKSGASPVIKRKNVSSTPGAQQQLSVTSSGPPPPNTAGAAVDTTSQSTTQNPPKKQLSFSDMIKQRASYVDSD